MELVGRLENGSDRFLKWAYKESYSGSPVISIPRHPDNIDALLTEAAACIREFVEWRPIETAPRDGTVVLTYGSLHNDRAPYGIGETPTVKISQFSPGHGAWCCDAWGSHEPVWWKPLPLPPAPGAET